VVSGQNAAGLGWEEGRSGRFARLFPVGTDQFHGQEKLRHLWSDLNRESLQISGQVRMIVVRLFCPIGTQVAKPYTPRANKKTGKDNDAIGIQYLGHAGSSR